MVVLVRRSQVLLAGLLCFVGVMAQPARSQARRVVHVTAERFAFTPSQIVVESGEEIELRVKSDDTAHGFRVAGTNVNIVIPKRGRQEVVTTLRIDTPGRYEFECTRMCGAGHNFMRGVLIVRDSAKKQ
jgi:heme/copper-type cytochrome/quinol oxidase subunit 2